VTKVSVIIPTYNRRQYIQNAIDSVLNQTYRDREIIVIDDASTDGTADWIAQTYPDIHLIRLSQNCGAAGARNQGLSNATGEFVAFLDSDDRWSPDYLEKQVESLQSHTNAVISVCPCLNIVDSDIQYVSENKPWHGDRKPIRQMLVKPLIITMSVVAIRRATLATAGYLNESLKIAHDREWYLRLLYDGDLAWIPDTLVTRFVCSDGITKGYRQWAKEVFQILDIFFADERARAYRSLESQLRSRWAINVIQALWDLKVPDLPLIASMAFTAIYFSPQVVMRGVWRRVKP
jgi:glycosyltransferase involved in cell wall biosynthesis